jgi:hypothetical protein
VLSLAATNTCRCVDDVTANGYTLGEHGTGSLSTFVDVLITPVDMHFKNQYTYRSPHPEWIPLKKV